MICPASLMLDIYVESVLYLGYCVTQEEHGLKITKEIGEIRYAHAAVISTLKETLMSYSHGNEYI